MQLYVHYPKHLHGIQSNNFTFVVAICGSAALLLSPRKFVRLPCFFFYRLQKTKNYFVYFLKRILSPTQWKQMPERERDFS